MIVALREEVPVVEKPLRLKEALRMTRRQVEAHKPVRMTRYREEGTVERLEVEPSEIDYQTNTPGGASWPKR
jgi:hypothetical protein